MKKNRIIKLENLIKKYKKEINLNNTFFIKINIIRIKYIILVI